jgi:nicotinate phosphoribosyltransferase
MGRGYFNSPMKDDIAYFDVFFRRVPDGGGYAVAAGLEQIIEYVRNLSFSQADISFLRSKRLFTAAELYFFFFFLFSSIL